MTVRKIGETAVHSPLKRVSLLVFAVIFFVSVTAFAVPPSLYSVTIYDGDSAVVVMTSQADPYDVLEDAGISVNENHGDEVSLKALETLTFFNVETSSSEPSKSTPYSAWSFIKRLAVAEENSVSALSQLPNSP